MNVLLAENSFVMSRIFTKLIQKALPSASIEHALDGQVAKQILNFERTNLVICNWHLPKQHGIEIVKQMKQDERLNKIPVILVTTMRDKKYVMTALKAGVNDICAIPVEPIIMVQKINKLAKKYSH